MHFCRVFADERFCCTKGLNSTKYKASNEVLATIYLNIAFLPNFCRSKVIYGRSTNEAGYCSWTECLSIDFFADSLLIVSHLLVALRTEQGAVYCSFRRAFWNNYVETFLVINFIITWNKLPNHCIFAGTLLIVSFV